MKEKQKGGVRNGAGRKPSGDPKQPVTIFVETSIIESMGGKEGVQFLCYGAIYGEKKFPVSDAEIKAVSTKENKKTVIKDLTKPTLVLKPKEQPKTNFSIDTRPKTLDELKKLCPAELEGFDRSKWIATERQKYGI